MIYTFQELLYKYRNYSNAKMKIKRLVDNGEIFYLGKGLYSDKEDNDECVIASRLYGPSYISFTYALGIYGLLLSSLPAITCATFHKNKRKAYQLRDGKIYTYQNVPPQAFRNYLAEIETPDGNYLIATKEKAFADFLLNVPVQANYQDLKNTLYYEYNIDLIQMSKLNKTILLSLLKKYRGSNFKLFIEHYKEIMNGKLVD